MNRTAPDPEQVVVQQRQLLDRVRRIPGVADGALATSMPMHGFDTFRFAVAGQPVDSSHMPTADFEAVTPSYFSTFRIRLVRGRFLDDGDTLGSPPVVMVNETFVRRYLPNDDPLTQRLQLRISMPTNGHGVTAPRKPEWQISRPLFLASCGGQEGIGLFAAMQN